MKRIVSLMVFSGLMSLICACRCVSDDSAVRLFAYYEPCGTNCIDVTLINMSTKPCIVAIPRPGEFPPGHDVFPVSIIYRGADGMPNGYVTGCPGSIYNMFLVPLGKSTNEKCVAWNSYYSFKMPIPFSVDLIEEVELSIPLVRDGESYTVFPVEAIRRDKLERR